LIRHDLEFKNILVIHFGQLGDVVLGLPALRAVRERFADAKVTLMVGRSAAEIARMANVADDYVVVDRVELRDSNKLWSINQVFKLVRDIRRRRFDFVVDLNSLYETNLLGFLSGAKLRLFENRERRSINILSNIKAPREDKEKHHTDRYLSVLEPLGISNATRTLTVAPPADELEAVDKYLDTLAVGDKRLIALFLGAGHPTRRWGIEKFLLLAGKLSDDEANRVLVLLGPEERELRPGLDEKFGDAAIVIEEMSLRRFYALLSRLEVLVIGDTGPMHLGAIAGADIVLLSEINTTQVYRPLIARLEVIEDRLFKEITPDLVKEAVERLLNDAQGRT
jgi:heptosyltransferase-1